MHFAIPEVKDLYDCNGTFYQAFDVHVNGALHCIVRYSQLHGMNEQLKQEYDSNVLPSFPPKRLFTLKGAELEDRRRHLETFIQEISQNEMLLQCNVFTSFLQKAQQETRLEESLPVTVDIYLMNGSKVNVKINSTDQTGDVQESFFYAIGLDEELVYYFGLFLVEDNQEDDKIILVRQLQDFECPYISLKCLQNKEKYKIVVRKNYWDPSLDAMILHDSVGSNLLYIQAQKDLKMGWVSCPKNTKKQLASLAKKGSKQEYMQLCQTVHKYGYIQFEPCESNYPVASSLVIVSLGRYEIRFKQCNNKSGEEATFQVTRIKSWKIACRRLKSPNHNHTGDDKMPKLQLSFEYLIDKENLKWISIQSDQAIVISMCIKSMVNEIVRKQKGNKIKKPSDRTNRRQYDYKLRDEAAAKLFKPQHNEDSQQHHQQQQSPQQQPAKESVTRRLSKKLKVNKKTFRKSQTSDDSDDFSLLSNALPMGGSGIGEDEL